MHFRLSRLRVALAILLMILLMRMRSIFVHHENISIVLPSMDPFERAFWSQLTANDQQLTIEQRLQRIETEFQDQEKTLENWTKVFDELYRRKLEKLDRRDQMNIYKSIEMENQSIIEQKTFEIIEETLVFSRPKFCSSSEIFHRQCPFKNCRWTCRKSSSNAANIRRANIFHHVDINSNEMIEKLSKRTSNDIWILWIDEANRDLTSLNSYRFNWTLSFRQDSEVSIGTYGLFIRSQSIHSGNQSDFFLRPEFEEILSRKNILPLNWNFERRILNNYRFRMKHALWFVSNCEPKRRLDFYQQLKEYFPVRAFGSCVQTERTSCNKNHPCEKENSYLALFYLAFESQTCTDYITEKFWRSLAYGMIPVVLGPKKSSYLDLGIPQSAFIHVDDYSSVKHLAEYLHRVANDYFLYRTFFYWLNHYENFYQMNDLEPIRMCELCMRLNLQDFREHRFYVDIHQWHRTEC